jgi:hypothetical protein
MNRTRCAGTRMFHLACANGNESMAWPQVRGYREVNVSRSLSCAQDSVDITLGRGEEMSSDFGGPSFPRATPRLHPRRLLDARQPR